MGSAARACVVDLARGDIARATASIHEGLDRPSTIPSKEWPPNTDLRRVPLLEAQVEIEIAAGDLVQARSAAEELGRVAALFQSRTFGASATLARGRVRLAEGDIAAASRDFETAAQQWGDIGAPYKTALARIGLANALRAEGKEERALLEFRAARATFERIGAIDQESRAAQVCGVLCPPGSHHCIPQLMRVSAMPPSSIAKGTTGRSGSRSTPHACAIRRGCSTWRVSSPILAASSTCLTSWPPAKLRPTCPAILVEFPWCLTRGCRPLLDRAPKRRIAGGSQRSTRTFRRRGRWRMLTGRRKLMPNANVASGNCPAQSDSAGAIDARRQR